jgi:hypothetical protein
MLENNSLMAGHGLDSGYDLSLSWLQLRKQGRQGEVMATVDGRKIYRGK